MNRGIIALSAVIFFSFVGAVFISLSATRVWSQSKHILVYQEINNLKYDALSCVAIARLNLKRGIQIFPSQYETSGGLCEIENVVAGAHSVQLVTKSMKGDMQVAYKSVIDRTTLDLISLVELKR